MNQEPWGQSLAIDLHECEHALLTNADHLKGFAPAVAKEIGMVTHGPNYVEKFGEGSLHGLSSMQFIETSSITVHLDDKGLRAFIDMFSCKPFDADRAQQFSKDYFGARVAGSKNLQRG